MEQKKYVFGDAAFWRITISLGLASFFVFASLYLVQPILPLFVKEYNVSVSEATLTISLPIIGLIIGLIVFGFLSDRIGRVPFIKYSLILAVIAFFIIPMTDSFALIILLRIFQGITLAGLPAAALAYINEEIDRLHIGVATALYIASNGLGGMAGRVFAGYLTDNFSLEVMFYSFGVLGTVIATFVFFSVPKSRFFEPSKLPIKQDFEGMLYHFKNPTFLIIIGMGVVLQYSFTSVWTFIPFHLESDSYQLSVSEISYTYFAYGFGVIGAPLAGWLAGHFGLRPVRITGIIVLSIGLLMTLFAPLWLIILGLCIICAGFFTAHSLTASTVAEEATHHKGSASSLYLVAYYIGVSLGSTLSGPIWNTAGWNAVILLAAIIPLVYLVLVNYVQKKAKAKKTA